MVRFVTLFSSYRLINNSNNSPHKQKWLPKEQENKKRGNEWSFCELILKRD